MGGRQLITRGKDIARLVETQHGNKKLTLKFSILQFSLWTTWCAFFSFAGMYFLDKGYDYSFVGAALSLAIVSGIAGQAFWGFLCDKMQSIKKIYILANILMFFSILTLVKPVSSLHIMISMAFLGFCQIPQPAVLDTWILKKNEGFPLNYGFIRMWAAIGFSFFGMVVGLCIDRAGYWVMFVFAAFFVICSVAVSLLTADVTAKREALKLGEMGKSYGRLLKNRKFLLFLVACFLLGLGNQASDNLRPLIMSEVGGNSGALGIIIFLSAITELPFFFYANKLSTYFNSRQCFIFSCCAYIIHFLLIAVADSIAVVAIGMMFQGIAFSLLLPQIRNFVDKNVTDELRTSGQTLTDALYAGLAGVIASASGAVMIQYTGVTVLYSICVGFAVSALWIFYMVTKTN